MTRRQDLSLLGIGLGIAFAMALLLGAPGYMDSDYYFATALRLVDGMGLTEPFLWNYLDDPPGLPHASHLYWMPLTSFLAAGSLAIFGRSFLAAQLPFILATAALPLLTARMTLDLTSKPRVAMMAGLFAAFPGFYLPFFVTTDAFSIYALIGSALLWLCAESIERPSTWRWLTVGMLVGVASLTRVDGILLLIPVFLALAMLPGMRLLLGLALASGFLAVMSPWWLRNLRVAGALSSPGAIRTLWMLEYDDLFSFPASLLTFDRWRAAGAGALAADRLEAAFTNLQSLVAVNGLVFLLPLMILGLLHLRHKALVKLAGVYLLLVFLSMSLVFPFSGARGGYFHSSAAVMPIFWGAAAYGLEVGIRWGADRRNWDVGEAQRVFGIASVALAALLTIGLAAPRVLETASRPAPWKASSRTYHAIGQTLRSAVSEPGLVAVNNPPGFHLATGLDAIVIPNGDAETLRSVVERYAVSWVVLEVNHPAGLRELYAGRENPVWLEQAATVGPQPNSVLIYRVRLDPSPP